ncbi:hypothetical protein F4803DRAFT_455010 [Xylaria telfairii]|nr:hypothetical protein F4803DRAFT_455010 [Xylaria telfairii]
MQVQIPVFSFRDCSPSMVTYCLRACTSPVRYRRVVTLALAGTPSEQCGRQGRRTVPRSRGKPQPGWVLSITSFADTHTHDFVNCYLRDIGGRKVIPVSFSNHGCQSVGQLSHTSAIVHCPLWSAQSEIRTKSWQHEDRRRSTPQSPARFGTVPTYVYQYIPNEVQLRHQYYTYYWPLLSVTYYRSLLSTLDHKIGPPNRILS